MMKDNLLVRKAMDTALLCEKYASLRSTGFLDPKEQLELKNKLPDFPEIQTEFFGGYENAERKMWVCFPLWEDAPQIPISILKITGRDIAKLSHRDYLGAVLGLGLKRDKIGDILVGEEVHLFAADDIADYICENLGKIGSVGVKVSKIKEDEFIVPELKFKEICGSVASFRLDAVLALALRESRNVVQRLIASERVNVNYELTTNPSKVLNEGDKISVRGYGKMIFAHIGNTSKKGRLFVTIKRYI